MDRILLIDDEKIIRDMLSVRLKDQGYKILTAINGQEGLKMFTKHNPQVTILDLRMPKMTGLEFLKELDPAVFYSNAFIVLTGFGEDEDVEACFNMGVQSFLRKPVNFYELLGSIKRSLNLISNQQEIIDLNVDLKQSNVRINSLIQNIPEIVWECDADLKFTFVSENVKKVMGYTAKSLIGKPLSDFVINEDQARLQYKLIKAGNELKESVQGLTIHAINRDGKEIPLQLIANCIFDDHGKPQKLIGTARDLQHMKQIMEKLDQMSEDMRIRIDHNNRIIHADPKIQEILSFNLLEHPEYCDLTKILIDPASINLISFAFEVKENVAFPVEIKLCDVNGFEHKYTTDLKYIPENHLLTGELKPIDTETQLSLAYHQINAQQEELANATVITPEMQDSIIVDGLNLSGEILDIVKALTPFAFKQDERFNLQEYLDFIHNKKLIDYGDTLRLLGNKIHGLKGTLGFLIPGAKQLCHRMEDLTRPLAEYKIVLTDRIQQMLKQFIFTIQDVLELLQKKKKIEIQLDEWMLNIDKLIAQSTAFIGNQTEIFKNTITQRSQDDGQIRKRKYEENLSVSHAGYNLLTQQVKNLFYMFSHTLSEEHLIQAGNLYNAFLDTHQQIQKVPLDLSRYERLVPSIAEQYSKVAELIINDYGVRADREFWNGVHEILNHLLKNSVIHGIETQSERATLKKPEAGQVSINLKEDALNIYITIADDGRGMNIDSIKQKVIGQFGYTDDKLRKMTDSEIYELVFLQGVSTAETLDDNAGRGVGLNAVQETMQQFQGSCTIKSTPGYGCCWLFTFPKSNVSLSCFIVTINDFKLAIPEDCVEAFYGYQESKITWINQHPNYRQNDEIVQLLDPKAAFDADVSVDSKMLRRILILKTDKEKMGLVINDIIHHANLPILALPEEYRNMPSYIGATLYGKEPVLVLKVS